MLVHDQLECLLRQHGVRGLINHLADVIQKEARANKSFPYGEPPHNDEVQIEDLLCIARNLRKDLY